MKVVTSLFYCVSQKLKSLKIIAVYGQLVKIIGQLF